jgi:hypothetical protein
MKIVSPSIRSTVQRSPRASGFSPTLHAVQDVPRNSALPNSIGGDVLRRHRSFTDETIDTVSRPALGESQDLFTKQPEGKNRDQREQNKLKP